MNKNKSIKKRIILKNNHKIFLGQFINFPINSIDRIDKLKNMYLSICKNEKIVYCRFIKCKV